MGLINGRPQLWLPKREWLLSNEHSGFVTGAISCTSGAVGQPQAPDA